MTTTPEAFVLTRQQVRELDRCAIDEYGVPGAVLMENAGRGAAELLISLGVHGPVLICCGKGNNGGDGLVIARHLDLHGVSVRVLLFARPEVLSDDAAINYRIVSRTRIALETCPEPDLARLKAELAAAEWTVDALYGTGLTGEVRPPLDAVIRTINRTPARVFAVDIPSGLDCDTGEPQGEAVKAQHTATFAALKPGFLNPAAVTWLGQVHVIHIGAPRELLGDA